MASQPADTVDTTDNDFDQAFAKFANPDRKPEDDAAAADPPADKLVADTGDDQPAGAADPAADGGDPVDPPAADPVDPPADGPAADAPADGADAADGDADDSTDAIIQRLSALLKDQPEKKPDEPKKPEAKLEQDIYSDEEKEFLADYDKEWQDVARGEMLKRRSEYKQLVDYMFSELAGQLRPVIETVEVLATRSHLAELQSKVSDYDQIQDQVIAWVEKQPAYLQEGMKKVINMGTADEVSDLIGRFRKDTGVDAKPKTPVKPKVELSDDAKKAADSLAPVNTKRSVPPADEASDDFDTAFARWAGSKTS